MGWPEGRWLVKTNLIPPPPLPLSPSWGGGATPRIRIWVGPRDICGRRLRCRGSKGCKKKKCRPACPGPWAARNGAAAG